MSTEADVELGRNRDLPRTAAHPFYAPQNQFLDQRDFHAYVEGLCQQIDADEASSAAARSLLSARIWRRDCLKLALCVQSPEMTGLSSCRRRCPEDLEIRDASASPLSSFIVPSCSSD